MTSRIASSGMLRVNMQVRDEWDDDHEGGLVSSERASEGRDWGWGWGVERTRNEDEVMLIRRLLCDVERKCVRKWGGRVACLGRCIHLQ